MTAQPFKLNVPQAELDDLQKRLARTRWPDAVEGWNPGTNVTYLQELVAYWQNQYDWRKHEAALNQFAHFSSEIDGLPIHFIHEKGKGPNPTPILLTHGWPDSFYRFYKLIPMLTDPAKFGGDPNASFDVIVPSMPGFIFSGHQPMAAGAIADVWAKLMTDVLGYEKFAAAGGDLGTEVTRSLATKYPQRVSGIHLTDVGYSNDTEDFATLSPAEQEFVAQGGQWWFTEGAYIMLHSTKPETLAPALTDSPVGLAAWLIEKFNAWGEGELETRFTKDELLTNIMLYWVTGTIESAMGMYQQNAWAIYGSEEGPKPPQCVEVPSAVASFPNENVRVPREWAERYLNLQRFTEMPRGGHFAALEAPELLAEDMRAFFHGLR